jgi:hypothetical protein
MRKGWLVFLLILIISGQALALSAFHDVEVYGFASGGTVVAIGKWHYVQGSVYISIQPGVQNGTQNVVLIFPNGTKVDLGPTPGTSYSFRVELPRTGDCCNGVTSGTLGLSQSQPMNITIVQNVGNATNYAATLKGEYSNAGIGIPSPIDLYVLVIDGAASISISGYDVGL